MKVQLWRIAHARSGDKADRADIGLFAFDAPTYEVLKREVTRERLAAHGQPGQERRRPTAADGNRSARGPAALAEIIRA